ncbi:MAG: prevent-host-death protein [Chloroflexi bacterium]|nr:prevent-host-death protein [Chloroflexota bacterium]
MIETQVQYVSDEKGQLQSVIVPIELWREILSERETAYLLQSDAMRQRLLAAIQRQDGIPFEEALEKLGI